MRAGTLIQWLWEKTHALKVAGLYGRFLAYVLVVKDVLPICLKIRE